VNRDRVAVVEHGKGQPLLDVHCEVRGPAITDLTKVFVQRRDGHPWSANLEKERWRLITGISPRRATKRERLGRCPCGVTYNQVDGRDLYNMRRACALERSTRDGLLAAIAGARRFIYFED
jgi:phosphatidylserine/phosphatidylglycerophosphate/cardiolipin synthase-like enzyme